MPAAEPLVPDAEEAERWLDRAREDLGVSALILGSSLGASWAACFHAQQAAEKALKGLLVQAAVDVPRSHALAHIASLPPQELAIEVDEQTLVDLSSWASKGRYPNKIDNPALEEARAMLEVARSVVDQATAHLA